MTALRATLRPMRLELVALTAVVVLLLVAALAVAARLASFNLPAACLDFSNIDPACAGRRYDAAAFQAFANSTLSPIRFLATLVPPLAGVILGIATVGKELDQRTAVLAWSLGPSRRRWLLQRVLPVAIFVGALGLLVPPFTEALGRLESTGNAFSPASDAPPEFYRIAMRGFAPAASALSAYGLTVLVGAMLGRLLPALLVALVFVVGATLIVEQGNHWLMSHETLVADQFHAGPGEQVDSLVLAPDGRIIGWDEAYTFYADPNTGELLPTVTQLIRYVPIEIYPQVAARLVLLHGLVALIAITLTFAVVDRRSP